MPSIGGVEFFSAKTHFQFCSEQAHWLLEQLILHTTESFSAFDKVHSAGD